MHLTSAPPTNPSPLLPDRPPTVTMPGALVDRLLDTTTAVHAHGLKSFGLLVASPDAPDYPYCASDVVFFDPERNRRNDPALRPAFEAQGTYFRQYDDAGFVADPAELLVVHRRLDAAGLEPVALFHTHRRQPANFSLIDYRLHNPAYPWHLVVSFRTHHPVMRAFAIHKDPTDFGIEVTDDNEASELAYTGPEVTPLTIAIPESGSVPPEERPA